MIPTRTLSQLANDRMAREHATQEASRRSLGSTTADPARGARTARRGGRWSDLRVLLSRWMPI
jgi:hypothetical protein